jgi:hypothetical protein
MTATNAAVDPATSIRIKLDMTGSILLYKDILNNETP